MEDARPPATGKTPEERLRTVVSRLARIGEISDEELREAWRREPARWRKSDVLKVSQLLLPSPGKAEEARRSLASGAAWLDVSRRLSVAPNAATGGAIGVVAKGDLPREFEKAVWVLPEGGVTAPLAAPHGVHVFRVDERLSTRAIPYEEARETLRLEAAEARSTAAVEALVTGSKKANPPSVVEEHLPFPYVGTLPHYSLHSRP